MSPHDRSDGVRTVFTFCRYWLASCGVEVSVEGNQVRKVSADKQNPHANPAVSAWNWVESVPTLASLDAARRLSLVAARRDVEPACA
jgi:hypothetical protein